jgi:hypothetical protein
MQTATQKLMEFFLISVRYDYGVYVTIYCNETSPFDLINRVLSHHGIYSLDIDDVNYEGDKPSELKEFIASLRTNACIKSLFIIGEIVMNDEEEALMNVSFKLNKSLLGTSLYPKSFAKLTHPIYLGMLLEMLDCN